MDQKPLNIAIVGCGDIAGAYGRTSRPYPQPKLLGATSRTLKRAEDFVATFGGKVDPPLEVILADDAVDLVINLTIHNAHVQAITMLMQASTCTAKNLSRSHQRKPGRCGAGRGKGPPLRARSHHDAG